MSPETVPSYSYPGSLENQIEILIELSYWRTHLALSMPFPIMEIMASITYTQYQYNTILDNAMLQLSCRFGESKCHSYWVTMLTNSSGTNHVPNKHEDFDQCDPYAIYTTRDDALL